MMTLARKVSAALHRRFSITSMCSSWRMLVVLVELRELRVGYFCDGVLKSFVSCDSNSSSELIAAEHTVPRQI